MSKKQHEENKQKVIEKVIPPMTDRELIDDLILKNRTMDALIKGLTDDIEIFKKAKGGNGSAPDIVRFTMQLNIMKDKKARNLVAINKIIKEENKNHE